MFRRSALFAAVGLALLLCTSSARAAAGGRAARTYTVVIDAVKFQPDALTIKLGDSVVWMNKDLYPHTSTSKAGGWDSKPIDPGESFKFTPTKAGEFPYICTLHTTMKATLKVIKATEN
jgi:plastocyanin